MTRHVAVLLGGPSAEREVSLVSGAAVAEALESRGYAVSRIDAGRDLAQLLAEMRPDVVFNALHGAFGEDGTVQGLMDALGLPYTHSGVLASSVAMHKPTALRVFRDAGLRVPEGRVERFARVLKGDVMAPPYVVKPLAEGSSVGVTIVSSEADLERLRGRNRWTHGSEVLVERYVPGRELTVAVLDDEPLAVTEIRPYEGFYDYRAKYTEHQAEHLVPAPLPQTVYDEAMRMAQAAHRVLGCRDVTRADLRYDDSGEPAGLYLLEINTQPGMTPLSLVPEQAAHVGIGFADLVTRMVERAAERR